MITERARKFNVGNGRRELFVYQGLMSFFFFLIHKIFRDPFEEISLEASDNDPQEGAKPGDKYSHGKLLPYS